MAMAGLLETTSRRFTADEVWAMVRAGILGEDERVELLEGELVPVSPSGYDHTWVVSTLGRLLHERYDRTWAVIIQSTVGAGRDSLPEPDATVVRFGDDWDTDRRVPECGETVLLIEVAVSSVRIDRRKARIYAGSGAPEYWIVDVPARTLVMHRGPRADGTWSEIVRVDEPATVELPAGGGAVAVADLMPPADATG